MKQCSVEGCERVARTRGMCDMHYLRVLRENGGFGGKKRKVDPVKVIEMYGRGMTQKQIAIQLGVSQSRVHQLLNGRMPNEYGS